MSSEHTATQLSDNPKKTLSWCTNSTSGPYQHAPIQQGKQIQQNDTCKTTNHQEQRASICNRLRINFACSSPSQRNTSTTSQVTHAHGNYTHLHTNRLPNWTPITPLKCSSTQTEHAQRTQLASSINQKLTPYPPYRKTLHFAPIYPPDTTPAGH